MRIDHVHDELSDYIDGACSDHRKVMRHLQSCPECAQHHMELLKLSHALRALPPLEADSRFTDGVMARVGGTTPLPRWRVQFSAHPMRVIALAASIMVVAMGAWYGMKSSQVYTPAGLEFLAKEAWLDDENVITAVAELIETDAWQDPFAAEEFEEDPTFEDDPTVDALIESLAASSGEDSFQAAWYESDDLLSVIETLAEVDVQLLTELTIDHWDEV